MTRSRVRSGTWLVVGMFGFGLALAGGLYAYLVLHTGPFQPLAAALAERYPGSAPRVDGGKRRSDRPGEGVLRIVMRVPFDPGDEARRRAFAREVAAFAARQERPVPFEVIEVHLFRERPGGEASEGMMRFAVEEVDAGER